MTFPLRTIKIYSTTELDTIEELAEKGFDMATVARYLDVSFTRFWLDYNNPALDVRESYDKGQRQGELKNRENMIKAADKSEGAQKNFNEEVQASKLRNKINSIRALRENYDL